MVDKKNKPGAKRLPKGQRTHERRLKQAARKEAILNTAPSSPVQPVRVPKKQDLS